MMLILLSGHPNIWLCQSVLRGQERAPREHQRQDEEEDLIDPPQRHVRPQERSSHDEERMSHTLPVLHPVRCGKFFFTLELVPHETFYAHIILILLLSV